MIKKNLMLIICILSVLASGQVVAAKGKTSLLDAYARLSELSQVQLSPDGSKIAFLYNKKEGETLVMAKDLVKNKLYTAIQVDNVDLYANWIRWANNERLLVSARKYTLAHKNISGMAVYTDRRIKRFSSDLLFAVNYDGKNLLPLFPARRIKQAGASVLKGEWIPIAQDNVISMMRRNTKHILVSIRFDSPFESPSVQKVNIYDRDTETVQHHMENTWDWMVDNQDRVRVGFVYDPEMVAANEEFIIKAAGKTEFSTLWKYNPFDEGGPFPLAFGKDDQSLIVVADHNGRDAIFSYNLNKADEPMTLLAADDTYDISGNLIWSEQLEQYIGVYYNGSEGDYIYWNDDSKLFQQAVDKALPGRNNFITSASDDGDKYVVYSWKTGVPGDWYLGDREKRSLEYLGATYPEVLSGDVPIREAVSYETRDGVKIEGYLTRPRAAKEGKPLPAIMLPHGGPHARDDAGFDFMAGYLAVKGYAVLQVNYRGSTGYGADFFKAGFKNWGLVMQDDVSDGVRWLVKQKIADPEKVCIVGASYGGYAAMVAAYKNTDIYKCAVSFAGVSDLRKLRDDFRWLGYKGYANMTIGDGEDDERLVAVSPIKNVDKLNVPLLLLHGDVDNRVLFDHSENLYKAAKQANKDVKLIVFEGGDHFLSRLDHRKQLLEETEKFVSRYIR